MRKSVSKVGEGERVDIEAVIARPGEAFTPAQADIPERLLRECGQNIPDKQLIEEIGLALAIHSRGNSK